MPYSKSNARIEFEKKVKETLRLSTTISYKRVNLSYDHKNMIYQSSIILLSSALETYLGDLIEEIFYNYKLKNASLSLIPKSSRTFAVLNNFRPKIEKFIFNKDERKVLNNLNIGNSIYDILNDNSKYLNQVTAKIIIGAKKYPSTKNVKLLYNRIGISDIFTETNRRGKKNYENLLQSFNDIRQTIAHEQEYNLTISDVKRNFSNISDFLNQLDRISYSHICKISGQTFWK